MFETSPAQAFIMSKVGGPHAMTLSNYLKKYVNVNRENLNVNQLQAIQNAAIRQRNELLSNLHVRGFNHGNAHSGNIIVTTTPSGKITGMWLIDFGLSSRTPLGNVGNSFNFAPRVKRINGAAPKLSINNLNELAKKLAKRRVEIANDMRLLTNNMRRVGRSKTTPNNTRRPTPTNKPRMMSRSVSPRR
jgi:hypothetical protein